MVLHERTCPQGVHVPCLFRFESYDQVKGVFSKVIQISRSMSHAKKCLDKLLTNGMVNRRQRTLDAIGDLLLCL